MLRGRAAVLLDRRRRGLRGGAAVENFGAVLRVVTGARPTGTCSVCSFQPWEDPIGVLCFCLRLPHLLRQQLRSCLPAIWRVSRHASARSGGNSPVLFVARGCTSLDGAASGAGVAVSFSCLSDSLCVRAATWNVAAFPCGMSGSEADPFRATCALLFPACAPTYF